jgi:hypothetical protein
VKQKNVNLEQTNFGGTKFEKLDAKNRSFEAAGNWPIISQAWILTTDCFQLKGRIVNLYC